MYFSLYIIICILFVRWKHAKIVAILIAFLPQKRFNLLKNPIKIRTIHIKRVKKFWYLSISSTKTLIEHYIMQFALHNAMCVWCIIMEFPLHHMKCSNDARELWRFTTSQLIQYPDLFSYFAGIIWKDCFLICIYLLRVWQSCFC